MPRLINPKNVFLSFWFLFPQKVSDRNKFIRSKSHTITGNKEKDTLVRKRSALYKSMIAYFYTCNHWQFGIPDPQKLPNKSWVVWNPELLPRAPSRAANNINATETKVGNLWIMTKSPRIFMEFEIIKKALSQNICGGFWNIGISRPC